ncbi:MAG: hypothetical protein ACP5O8_01410 [Candidatus Aenigmatarchaeota archaeon]
MAKKLKLPKLESKILKKMWLSCSEAVAKALKEMINREVEISSTSLKIMLLNDIPKLLNPEETSLTIFFIRMKDDIEGVIQLSSPLKDILKMADIFLKKEIGYFKDLSDENLPVLKELTYILSGYFVDAVQKLFNTKYNLSEPFLSINPFRAIEEFGFDQVYKEEIYVLVFLAELKIPDEKIEQKITLLFKSDDIGKILDLISEKIKLEIS